MGSHKKEWGGNNQKEYQVDVFLEWIMIADLYVKNIHRGQTFLDHVMKDDRIISLILDNDNAITK